MLKIYNLSIVSIWNIGLILNKFGFIGGLPLAIIVIALVRGSDDTMAWLVDILLFREFEVYHSYVWIAYLVYLSGAAFYTAYIKTQMSGEVKTLEEGRIIELESLIKEQKEEIQDLRNKNT